MILICFHFQVSFKNYLLYLLRSESRWPSHLGDGNSLSFQLVSNSGRVVSQDLVLLLEFCNAVSEVVLLPFFQDIHVVVGNLA